MSVHRIGFRAIAHATEDLDRVLKAMEYASGSGDVEPDSVESLLLEFVQRLPAVIDATDFQLNVGSLVEQLGIHVQLVESLLDMSQSFSQ